MKIACPQNPMPRMGLAILGTIWALGVFLAPLTCLADESRPVVTVSILPQVWFVEKIAGDKVSVEALVGPGHSPATFEPTARQMARLQESIVSSDLKKQWIPTARQMARLQESIVFFSSGVPFERGLLPRIEAARSMPPVRGLRPESSGHAEHNTADGHHHHHPDELDPHTWLDPSQASAMADTIGTTLSALIPAQAEYFSQRTLELKTQLQALDQELRNMLEPVRGQSFFVYHPAYGHFAKAYGLNQIAVESQGHEPGPRQLGLIIDKVKETGCRAIIVQPQFSQKSAKAVARSTGAEILTLDPLAARYDTNLMHIARTLAKTLKDGKP